MAHENKKEKSQEMPKDGNEQKADSGLEAAELKDLLQRTQANFENYRKQTEKRIEEIQQFAAKNTILDLLPILDNFELALKNATEDNELVKGIRLIQWQFNNLLEKNKLKTIETEKQTFDPYLHEALMKVESEMPENMILEEFQKGFTLHGQVIRHAKVKLSTGKKETKENNEIKRNKNSENKGQTKENNDKIKNTSKEK